MLLKVPAVWLVDDDEDDRLVIRSAFDDVNPPTSVLTLNNSEQLFAELAEGVGLPRLILLDLNMPGLDGFETLRQLRATPAFAQLPVVILTTSTSELDKQQSLKAGANEFITKPATYQELATLANQLSNRWVRVESQ